MQALKKIITTAFIFFIITKNEAQNVNVFLGTSGDHGQLSPAASYPFSMLSIGPQTYPNLHAGYEYKAKIFLGFTHNRIEGVGCRGSGGNLLIKPFMGSNAGEGELIKRNDEGEPGYYKVFFQNGISASFTVNKKSGIEVYRFPAGTKQKGVSIDCSHAFANGFWGEEHVMEGNKLEGWIRSGTTCKEGKYKFYYCIEADKEVTWKDSAHLVTATIVGSANELTLRIGISSVSIGYARASVSHESFETLRAKTKKDWQELLAAVKVEGDPKEADLFYSLLYRALQSPFNITEPDGSYRGNDGSLQHTNETMYNGWAIWDNYRTQLPLLSLLYPSRYQNIIHSIENLYRYGKKNWATMNEPSNSVRTEHAVVTLLDACRKSYAVDLSGILDSLRRENDSLDYSHIDKSLESSYDSWALSEIAGILQQPSLQKLYRDKAAQYRRYWNKDFRNIDTADVDKLEARGMYQGTIWQYRWLVPFDMVGLQQLCGGDAVFVKQLDRFFEKDYYNAANETDIQVPYMYNATTQPWKSQAIIHKYAGDTVVQYYYDLNYRGIDPTIGRVFNDRPDAFVKSMDDDAGAMSSWYCWAACGLSPACTGYPLYYLSVPLFSKVTFTIKNENASAGKIFHIEVKNFNNKKNYYIESVTLNGKPLDRNWITHQEITKGGRLVITASDQPNKNFGVKNQWTTKLEE